MALGACLAFLLPNGFLCGADGWEERRERRARYKFEVLRPLLALTEIRGKFNVMRDGSFFPVGRMEFSEGRGEF